MESPARGSEPGCLWRASGAHNPLAATGRGSAEKERAGWGPGPTLPCAVADCPLAAKTLWRLRDADPKGQRYGLGCQGRSGKRSQQRFHSVNQVLPSDFDRFLHAVDLQVVSVFQIANTALKFREARTHELQFPVMLEL